MSVLTGLLAGASTDARAGAGLVCDGRLWSYSEVAGGVERAAGVLARADIRPGDRVALHLRNSLELVLFYFACFRHGAVAVPVNTRFRTDEVHHVLQDCGAAMYVGERALCDELTIATPAVPRTLMIDSPPDAATGLDRLFTEQMVGGREPMRVDPDLPAVILYTSGTTARPKGVVHTQRTLGEAARLASGWLFAPDDIVGIPSLMVHAAGLLALLASVHGRRTAVVLNGDCRSSVDMVQRHRISAMLGLPAMYWELLEIQQTRRDALVSLRSPIVCGDVVSSRLKNRFARECAHELKPHYGMTEAFPITYGAARGAEVGLLGRPIPGVALRVVDAEERDSPAGTVGDLLVRSPAMMIGYWASDGVMRAALDDGWLRTGDVGFQDVTGHFWLTGRRRDVIVRGGSKIAPAEVEEVLLHHPHIQEAAVVGVPDAVLGEVVAGLVVPMPGMNVDPVAVTRFVREHLADYKVPETVLVMDRLPRTSTGKVDRREVCARLAGGLRPDGQVLAR